MSQRTMRESLVSTSLPLLAARRRAETMLSSIIR